MLTDQWRVGWASIEPEDASWISVEHREIGNPAEIENHPSTWLSGFSCSEQDGIGNW